LKHNCYNEPFVVVAVAVAVAVAVVDAVTAGGGGGGAPSFSNVFAQTRTFG
jgi:hypothetical protein